MDAHALVRRFGELCSTHDLDSLGEVIAVDYRQHNPMVEPGLDGIRAGFAQFLAVFPDLRARTDAVVAQGDLVVARFTWTGTQRAPFMGRAASGRTASWVSTDWWRIEDGKLAEHWDVVDWAGLLAQLPSGDDADGLSRSHAAEAVE